MQVLKEVEGGPTKSAISGRFFQKLEKLQNFLKLITSSVRGGRREANKICDFSKNCKKLENT